ncbi:MAG: thiolase family protein, partial [Dehalococcoidales bacterium]
MKEAVVVDVFRTPIGQAGEQGVYKAIAGNDLIVQLLKAIYTRNKFWSGFIDEVVSGYSGGGGIRGTNLVAGWPYEPAGSDTTRACASSSEAIAICAEYIMNDDADIQVAAGLETPGRSGPLPPPGMKAAGMPAPPTFTKADYPEGWKFAAKILPQRRPDLPEWIGNLGRTAEELAQRFDISREDADDYAWSSHQKARAAQDADLFKDSIFPITIQYEDDSTEVIEADQAPSRDVTLEKLKALPPVYMENGKVTAGNSGAQNEGSGLVVLMSKERAKELGLKPIVTFRTAMVTGVDPLVKGTGAYAAIDKVLKRTGMKIQDFDIIEINEASAAEVLYTGRQLGFNSAEWDKTNVNGGAISIGYPIGLTGITQTEVLAREMARRNLRFGLAALSATGGQGMATIFEREN